MNVLTAWVATVLVRFNAMISLLKGVSTYIVPCLFLQRKTKISPISTKGSGKTDSWAFYTQNCLASWVREVRIRCWRGKRSESEATVFIGLIEIGKFVVHDGLSMQ